MKTTKTLLWIPIFIWSIIASAQIRILPQRPYEKLTFEGLHPVWHETCFDATFIGGDTCNGYNLFERSFYEEALFEYPYFYKIHHRWGLSQANGTYIQKRHIETGQLIWQTYYGLPVDDRQEFGRLLYLNEQNQLEVISLLKRSAYKTPGDGLTSFITIPSKRIYDKQTGHLLFADLPDVNDTTLFQTNFSVWKNYNKFIRKNSDSLTFYDLEVILNNGWFFNHIFSKLQIHTKKNDVVKKVIKGNDGITLENLIKIHENEYLIVETGSDSGQAIFMYFDGEFNLKEQHFSDFIGINIKSLIFRSYDPVRNTILLTYRHLPNGKDPTPQDLIVLDRQGNILRRATLDAYYKDTYGILSGSDHNEIQVLASGINSDENKRWFTYMDVLDWNEDGFHVTKRYHAQDSLRIFADLQIFQVTPDHYLINWWERSFYYDQYDAIRFDIFSSAISWIYIKASDLITVNTKDIENSFPCKVYPVPALDRLHIEFDTPVKGTIMIYDMAGRFIQSIPVDNLQKTEADVSFLTQGSYVLYIHQMDGSKNQMQKAGVFYKH
jgi:hypothetical protein